MLPGVFIAVAMIPYVYYLTKKSAAKSKAEGKSLQPEVFLYWAMAGASILMPISLFWMAWTCYVHEWSLNFVLRPVLTLVPQAQY